MPNDMIEIVASLDINASITQINKDLKKVQEGLNKLIISAKLDKQTEKNIKNLTQSLTQLQRITEQLEKQKIDLVPKDNGGEKVLDLLKQIIASIDEIKAKDFTVNTGKAEKEVNNVKEELDKVKVNADGAGKSLKEMLSGVGINLSAYQALRLIREAINEIGDAVDDYNKYKTNLRIITGEPDNVVDEMLSGYTEESIKLGIDISEYQNAAEAILRTGKNAAETNMILKDSAVLSKTGFIDSEKAANNLITIANAYDMEADAIENVVDKLLSLDVASQTEGGALSTAVARTAKNAQLAGVTLDSLAAQIANLRDVTGKEEEQLATSLNSIYSRMYNVKLNKFIIEDESGVEDITEDISDMERILTRVGLQLRDSKGTFRDFDDIIKDLHDHWSEFNEVEKSAIGKTIGGTYHRNVALAMIQDYEDFQKLQNISLNSAGTAAERYEAHLDSISAKSAELETALKRMWSNTISDDVVTDVKGAATEVVQFIDNYEVLQNLLKSAVIYAAAKGFVYLGGTVKDAYTSMAHLSQAFSQLSILKSNAAGTTAYQEALSSIITHSASLSDAQLKLLLSTKSLTEAQRVEILQARGLSAEEAAATLATMGLTTAEGTAATATISLSGAFETLSAAIASNPIGAATTVIMGVLSLYSIMKRKSEEAEQAEKALQDQIEQNIAKYKSEESQIDSLITKYSELSASGKDIADVRKQLADMQAQLVSDYGNEAESIDLINGKYSEQIEKLYELKRARADVFVNDQDNIDAYNKELDKLNNAGNINGSIDVEIKNRGGLPDDVVKAWEQQGLIEDFLQYTMSSSDFGISIVGGENLKTQYEALEKMADIYKEVSTAADDFNEAQYTAIKQQAIAAKETYDKAKAVTDFFEQNKQVAEFKLSAESQRELDTLLDKAKELNTVINSNASAVEKDIAVGQLADLRAEIEELAAGNPELETIIEGIFTPVSDYAASAQSAVSGLNTNWKSSLNDIEKNTLESVEKIKKAMQSLAEGTAINHDDAWAIFGIDDEKILNKIGVDAEGKFLMEQEQLIELKDGIINKRLKQINKEREIAAESVQSVNNEIETLRKQLASVTSETDAAYYKSLISEAQERAATYGGIIQRDTLLIQELNANLGDTNDIVKAVEARTKAATKEIDEYFDAQKREAESQISILEDEKSAIEGAKQELQEQLDILNAQKATLEEITENYEKVGSAVSKTIKEQVESIEEAYNAQIDALKAQNEEREEALDLAEKLANLENAKNKKVRTYTEAGGWQYEAKKGDIDKAQKDYDKALAEQEIKRLEAERDNAVKGLKDYAEKWAGVKSAYSDALNATLADEILGADWREKIAEQDEEIFAQYKREYNDYSDQLTHVSDIEIATVKKSIEAKNKEIAAKESQIKSWQKYKSDVTRAANESKAAVSDWNRTMLETEGTEKTSLDNRTRNLETFYDKYSGILKNLKTYQDELNESVNGFDVSSMQEKLDALEINWEEVLEALKEYNRHINSNSDAELHAIGAYADGGVNTYTGLAMLHGTKQRPELVLNSTDTAKLYNAIHNSPTLAPITTPNVAKVIPAGTGNAQNTVNVNVANLNLPNVQNPEQFARQMESYMQTVLTESQVFKPRR